MQEGETHDRRAAVPEDEQARDLFADRRPARVDRVWRIGILSCAAHVALFAGLTSLRAPAKRPAPAPPPAHRLVFNVPPMSRRLGRPVAAVRGAHLRQASISRVATIRPEAAVLVEPTPALATPVPFSATENDDPGDSPGLPEGGADGTPGGVDGASNGGAGGEPGGIEGGVVLDFDRAPERIRTPAPRYPPEVLARRTQGTVVLEVVIDASGRVARARVIQSVPDLDEAAVRAVREWTFTPAVKNGRRVATLALVPVRFRLL